jgi:putative tricarboxylic transport membrane protein
MVTNRLMAVIIGLFALAYLWLAYQIPIFPIPRPIDSDAFPKLLGYVMLGLAAWLFFEKPEADQAQAHSTEAAEGTPLPWAQWQPVVLTAVAIAVYAGLLGVMGFVLASAALTAGLTFYYGYRRHFVNAAVSVLVPLVLYVLMTRFMNIHLPSGWLPF